MRRWHLPTLAPSSDKQHQREPGAGAPRVATVGRSKPRVLFSEPECRAVVVDLRAGEEMGDHAVHERAVIEIVSGRIAVTSGFGTVDCESGTLINLERGEHHAVRALVDSQLLLLLAPWPAKQRNHGAEEADPHHLPRNAVAPPDDEARA
jgi:quercetin dioxygenase-like cupin family protein